MVVVVAPGISEVFSAVPLNINQWMTVGVISIAPILIMEVQKKINEVKFGRVIYKKQKV